MDSFIQNFRKKVSVDSLVEMMKEADVIDEDKLKEEQVRKTLSKIDPDTLMDVDEMANKLNELTTKKSKPEVESTSTTKAVIDAAKNALQKLSHTEAPVQVVKKEESHPFFKEDNLFSLYDDFR